MYLRIPKIFEELKNTDADIIGLEEMTPTFVRALLSQDWVRQHYYVSDNGMYIDLYFATNVNDTYLYLFKDLVTA